MTREVLEGGTVLKQRYIIDELMGMGGFANAYRAWDPLLECTVAIKEYREDIPGFLEEARITAQYRSCPNIIYVYDFFEENGAAYIVMEFLNGCTLKKRIERDGKIPRREAIAITLAVLGALQTIHESGMVHRDVAPDNVFLLENGKVKLFDFGCAGRIGTPRREIVVKKGYSPPEQYIAGCIQEPSCDVYAAAAMLVQMLSGVKIQSPEERRTWDHTGTLIRKYVRNSRRLRKTLLKALRPDVLKRIQTAREFASELENVREEKGTGTWTWIILLFALLTFSVFAAAESGRALSESTSEEATSAGGNSTGS